MKLTKITCALALSAFALPALAADITVSVTNLTNGNYFTPILVSAHASDVDFFEAGTSASTEIQTMAEGGDIAPLAALATSQGAVNSENPNAGPLAPAATTTTADFDTLTNTHLTITAMVLPTNDGFIGLDSWEIPTTPGTYTFTIDAYDAGTEANDEILNGGGAPNVAGIPADPGSNSGTGATGVTTTEANEMIHIHRGVLGDSNPTGGMSDLNSSVHRWLNPVARVSVTVR